MTLLSLFMTSTGIFCFVPISHRLIESGIVPASNNWRFQRLPFVLAPTFYDRTEERLQFLLADNKAGDAWLDAEVSVLVRAVTRVQVKASRRVTECDLHLRSHYTLRKIRSLPTNSQRYRVRMSGVPSSSPPSRVRLHILSYNQRLSTHSTGVNP